MQGPEHHAWLCGSGRVGGFLHVFVSWKSAYENSADEATEGAVEKQQV